MVVKKLSEQLQESVDLKNIKAPVITLLSIAGMIVWATNSVWEQKQNFRQELSVEVNKKLDELGEKHKEIFGTLKQQQDLLHQIEEAIATLKRRQRFIVENIWTQKDHAIWCYEAQRSNKDFVCPDDVLKKSGLIGTDKFSDHVDRDRNQILKNMENEKNGLFGGTNSYHKNN